MTNYSVTFDFMGKSGKHHVKKINDRRIAKIIKQLDEAPGYEIFRYRDEDGEMHNISSADVNSYIKEYMGDDFTAKDFRTWGGTLLAVDFLAAEAIAESQAVRKSAVTTCVQRVSQKLGNTPAIARSSYINPKIFVRYMSGEDFNSIRQTIANMKPPKYISKEEYCALKILEGEG